MKDLTEEELDEFLWELHEDYGKMQEYLTSDQDEETKALDSQQTNTRNFYI